MVRKENLFLMRSRDEVTASAIGLYRKASCITVCCPRRVFKTSSLFLMLVLLTIVPGRRSFAGYRRDTVLIQTERTLSRSELSTLLKSQETSRNLCPSRIRPVYAIQLSPKENPLERIRQLHRSPDVRFVEPNYIHRLHETLPDDSFFTSHQWSLKNTGQFGSIPGEDIDAANGWDIETGTSSVVVAVIDTGVALEHPDLTANLWNNAEEIPGDGIDNDDNGYVDDWRGWNFAENHNDPSDVHSHGTHVAGIIGAIADNALGIAGVCWNCTIQPLACFDSSGEATNEDVVEAIYYAIDNGAKVINASWGDQFSSDILEDAVRAANENGILFVASAGNDGLRDVDLFPVYPAGSPQPNVISVAASDSKGQIAGYSNQGPATIDLFAPGSSIYSSVPAQGYSYKSGTSMSAPHVTGAAALLLSHFPGISVAELRGRILGSVDILPDYEERVAFGGRLNLSEMYEDDTVAPSPVEDLAVIRSGWDAITLAFTTTGDDGYSGSPSGFDIRYSEQVLNESNWGDAQLAQVIPKLVQEGVNHTFTVRGLDPDIHYSFAVRIYDNAGNHSSLSNVVSGHTAAVETLWVDPTTFSQSRLSPVPEASWSQIARCSDAILPEPDYCWTESPSGDYGNDTESSLVSVPFAVPENALLSFEHWHDFHYSAGILTDGGEVQISLSSEGADWITIARFYGTNSPWRREVVSLQPFAGAETAQVRFRFFSDSRDTADGWYIDNVHVFVPEQVSWPEDIIIESTTRFRNLPQSSRLYEETVDGGVWYEDTAAKARRYGLSGTAARMKYVDTVGSKACFKPSFLLSGWYEIFGIWGSLANAENLTYIINHAFGQDCVLVTQCPTVNANKWVSLGTYYFQAGSGASVTIDDSTVTGSSNPYKARVDVDSIKCVFTGRTHPVEGNFIHLLGE